MYTAHVGYIVTYHCIIIIGIGHDGRLSVDDEKFPESTENRAGWGQVIDDASVLNVVRLQHSKIDLKSM